ncbi:LOW QUALITY PROTEIN: acetamidase/formamidase [Pseudonocardia alni]|uniref:Acetamidase/formamidase n=2 Tax=Pseudonocardia alni TaxID=33907 RepID=A0AA44UTD0_PSEA5|nr:LOW QUALITY PROTEIN: acetamidase/formamidase [Pseudonocardia alni]
MAPPDPRPLLAALGRRDFLRAAATVTAAGGLAGCGTSATVPGSVAATLPDGPLQPGAGDIPGDHYLGSDPADVRWGYVPAIGAAPVLTMRSGQTVTIDTVSHEGILEDQGRDPVAWFGRHGVAADGVLSDAVAVARDYRRTPRDVDADGPHVITGPVFVEGARPGDVLKVETLSAVPRVPYGVVSSRHGKGALGRTASGAPPAGIALDEVMPRRPTDGRATGDPARYGTVSVFTPVRDGADGPEAHLAFGEGQEVSFPLRPFMGTMGVAHAAADAENAPELNSIPPTLGGGNIDIRLLGPDSAFYLPVRAEGALFHVGDPHLAMGDGEVALTALEGSLRATFRLTVCRPGEGTAPSVAFGHPFGETPHAWVPIGLSDPDGSVGGQKGDLDVAMRRAVVNALDFLQEDRGMDRATAYAYLSAAADFAVSQVVDRTVGVHGVIPKAHFRS